MKKRRPIIVSICLVFIFAIALSGYTQTSNGKPFNELWTAISALQEQLSALTQSAETKSEHDADINALQVQIDELSARVAAIEQGLPTPEICDGIDNDLDGEIDEDFNLQFDPDNCGTCGNVCSQTEVCFNGTCAQIGGGVCSTTEISSFTSCLSECDINSNPNCILSCVQGSGLSTACSDAILALGLCGISTPCFSDLQNTGNLDEYFTCLSIPENCGEEFETAFGDLPSANSPCDDDNPCTIGDVFNAFGICQSGSPKTCNDNNVCTADSCDINTGACINDPIPGC